jgi:hypothetical protein
MWYFEGSVPIKTQRKTVNEVLQFPTGNVVVNNSDMNNDLTKDVAGQSVMNDYIEKSFEEVDKK